MENAVTVKGVVVKKPEVVSGKIEAPTDIAERLFLDSNGELWKIGQRVRSYLGLLQQKVLTFQRAGLTLDESFRSAFSQILGATLAEWLKDAAPKELSSFIARIGKMSDECIAEGEKNFRRDLIKKLGEQGENFWTALFGESLDDLKKYLALSEGSSQVITCFGMVPVGTRCHWTMKNAAADYEMFCIEAAPQKRTIKIFGATKTLAFPWMYFLVCFKNGSLFKFTTGQNGHVAPQAFWAFYRPTRLQSANDEIFFPNLPNIDGAWPNNMCLGHNSFPNIILKDESWADTLMQWFWDSDFEGSLSAFYAEAKRIPEVSSLDAWADLSKTAPEKMLKLPWRKLDKSLNTLALEVLDWFGKTFDKTQASDDQKIEQAKFQLAKALRGSLEEKLFFLGAHFSVPADSQEAIAGKVTEELPILQSKLANSFDAHCQPRIVASAGNFITITQRHQPRKGGF